jgi:hypothetical protein
MTIFEALQTAESNLKNFGATAKILGAGQLHIAVMLLENGYGLDDPFDPSILENTRTLRLAA